MYSSASKSSRFIYLFICVFIYFTVVDKLKLIDFTPDLAAQIGLKICSHCQSKLLKTVLLPYHVILPTHRP